MKDIKGTLMSPQEQVIYPSSCGKRTRTLERKALAQPPPRYVSSSPKSSTHTCHVLLLLSLRALGQGSHVQPSRRSRWSYL